METATANRKSWCGTPQCDFCGPDVPLKSVFYDAATRQGPWACMCRSHFSQFGRMMGQQYKLDKADGRWYKVKDLGRSV